MPILTEKKLGNQILKFDRKKNRQNFQLILQKKKSRFDRKTAQNSTVWKDLKLNIDRFKQLKIEY